jgi:hypothetical protein
MRNITLTLLREGGYSVAHKLMRTSAADPFDAKGERRVLENGEVTEVENLSQKLGGLFRLLTEQLFNRRIRIAKSRSGSHYLFGIGSMRQKLDEHGHRFQVGPRRPGCRAVSRNGTRERLILGIKLYPWTSVRMPRETASKKGTTRQGRPHNLVFLFVSLAETLDSTGGVHQLLLTGVKRMAGRTNFRGDITLFGRLGFKGGATVTFDRGRLVFGMDSFFHRKTPVDLALYRSRI